MSPALACPQCGQIDQVRSVPAAHLAGGGTIHAGRWTDWTVSDTRFFLNPPQPPQPISLWVWSAITLGVVFAMCGGVLSLAAAAARDANYAVVGLIGSAPGLLITFAFTALAMWLAHRKREQRSSHARMMQIWSRGWWCHRCAGVFLPEVSEDNRQAGRLISPNEFHHLVTQSGA